MLRTSGPNDDIARLAQVGRRPVIKGLLGLFWTTLASSGTALAQQYPAAPIRMIVPFPPGGATDLVGRYVAAGLARRLNQTVIVDNRAGAGGTLGVMTTIAAAPDGYTLVFPTSSTVAVDPVQEHLTYKPATDLVPVAPVAALPYLIFTHPSFPPNTIGELIAAAKKAPGTISFASAGLGLPAHMATELLRAMAGIDLVHVPYRGAAPAVSDVVGGQVQFMTGDVSTALSFVESKQLKAIAVTGKERVALLPDVPTVAESGLTGFEAEGWFGVFAPAKTPMDVVGKLERETAAIVEEPAFVEFLARFGGRPLRMNRDEFIRFIETETRIRSDLIRTRGIAVR